MTDAWRTQLTRRGFLAGSAAIALAACSSSGTAGHEIGTTTTTTAPRVPPRPRIRRPGERWDTSKPEGTDLLPRIEHIVLVMKENHSYDNYLGMLGRGDGLHLDAHGRPTNTCRDREGKAVRSFHMPNTCQNDRPSQNWNSSHTQWNNGRMDGFVRSPSGAVSMGYFDGSDLPFYYDLAATFPLCDRWFASCMAQTYPNRRFLLAGTAGGNIRTTLETLSDPMPPNGTIMQALNRNSIEWRDYYTTLPTIGLWPPVVASNRDRLVRAEEFFVDAAAGTLPAFCLVEPHSENASEENPQDISRGEAFSARVVDAVMRSPKWSSTVVIWCFDEHGGYYDHVAPPAAPKPDGIGPKLEPGDVAGAYDRLGFRVPAVVIAPFARRNYVSSVVRDHTAVLGLLEHKFNLPALTHRDGWADDLTDCFDFDGPPAFAVPPHLAASLNTSARDSTGTAAALCTAPGDLPH